jgi:4-hydroxybenzoyl-CoA reductase subunit beta
MLRLPQFTLERPTTIEEAIQLVADANGRGRFLAGGTDLIPNLKHEFIEADVVVALGGIEALRGIEVTAEGGLSIGPLTSLVDIAESADVQRIAPALAQAVGTIAGPQHRQMGTIGGNVMLDTRCQWINQSHFWRSSLGFCLKKDGSACHVVEGGKRCVAAASNDSAPALATLAATLDFQKAPTEYGNGKRTLAFDELFKADGAWNKKVSADELLTRIHIPATPVGHKGGYAKLRMRGSIDFPLLGVAARLDVDGEGVIEHADIVVIALQARPLRVRKASALLVGAKLGAASYDDALAAVMVAAYEQCHPLPNIPGDHEWRQEMVPIYVKRALAAAIA